MKKEKRLSKREKKAQSGVVKPAAPKHIHCVACGRHLDAAEMSAKPPTATLVRCQHGTQFASCADCVVLTRRLLAEHDRTGQPVQSAGAWH